MRVVFLEDVEGVAQGGQIKEVKRGFARNYLIPKNLATPATKDALQRIEKLGKKAEDQRLKNLADMKAMGEEIDGQQIPIEMRAGASGRLYGSVTTAIVADKLSEMTAREIERRTVLMPDSIRQTGRHDLQVRLHPDVAATVTLIVYPMGSTVEEFLEALEAAEAKEAEEAAEAAAGTDTPEAEATAEEETPEAEPAPDEEPEEEEAPETEEEPTAEEETPQTESTEDVEPVTEQETNEKEPAEDEAPVSEDDVGEAAVEEETKESE